MWYLTYIVTPDDNDKEFTREEELNIANFLDTDLAWKKARKKWDEFVKTQNAKKEKYSLPQLVWKQLLLAL